MSKQTSILSVVEAIIAGYKEAHSLYEEMSGGQWLWGAPEYFITSTVAKYIHSIPGNKYITLESSVISTLQDAGARGRGKLPADIRENGRADITLWWANGKPRAVIELKNQLFSNKNFEKDIKRIKSLLQRNSVSNSYQFGVFAFYGSSNADSQDAANEKLSISAYNFHKKSQDILGDSFCAQLFKSEINQELENNAWHAACILIKLKKI